MNKYRLLENGEVIHGIDYYLEKDGATWTRVPELSVGTIYQTHIQLPMRRCVGKMANAIKLPSPPEPVVESPKMYPDSEGFYWAKFGSAKYWQIVQVYGNLPFFQIIAFNELERSMIKMSSEYIKEWGPRFDRYEG